MTIEQPMSVAPRSRTAILKRWFVMLSVSVGVTAAMLGLILFTEFGRETEKVFAQTPAQVAFDLRTVIIEQKQILSGGQLKDGIPAL